MKQLTNITADAIQTFTLLVGDEEAQITLRYYPTTQIWCFDLTFRNQSIYGIKLSLGILHIDSYNFPFDFIVQDTSNLGLDPLKLDDFEQGRTILYMLTAEEMAIYRGYNVKI
jgi:hypothetical protein